MSEATDRLRAALKPSSLRVTVRADDLREVLNLISLERIYAPQLTSSELKLVDKHCDWPAFKHAFNCVMKDRLGRKEWWVAP